MDLDEFCDRGYLQEVNRQWFHPLGLALMVRTEEDGTKSLAGLWDCRDDPEGIYFSDGIDADKAERISLEFSARATPRYDALGYVFQPVELPIRFKVESVENPLNPFVKWWRHPWRWWRFRFLRADIRASRVATVDEVRDELERLPEDEIINGSAGRA